MLGEPTLLLLPRLNCLGRLVGVWQAGAYRRTIQISAIPALPDHE